MIDETIFDDDFGCIINSAVRYALGRLPICLQQWQSLSLST